MDFHDLKSKWEVKTHCITFYEYLSLTASYSTVGGLTSQQYG